MMGTRAAAFAGKISNLRESLLRFQNGLVPQPSCIDLANMLKYFCQVLHDFRDFKDIEDIPLYASEKRDRRELIKTLPNFDYTGLFKTLTHLIDVLPLIPQPSNGIEQLGANLLMLFKCLVPFLDQTNMEMMPYLVSSLFMSLPQSLHKDILDTLCFNLLPFTIDQQQRNAAALSRKVRVRQRKPANGASEESGKTYVRPVHCIVRIENSADDDLAPQQARSDSFEDQGIGMIDGDQADDASNVSDCGQSIEEEEFASLSVTSILMIAFHYINEPMHHSQLVECLMKLKNNVFEDLLFVIAYGTTRARCPAVEMLFRYWPDICPGQQDRKSNSQTNKLRHVPWQPTKCQNKNCSFTTLDDDEAVKMCLDFKTSIALSELPPPMLVCLDCVDSIYKQQLISGDSIDGRDSIQILEDYDSKFIDLLLPMERISKSCENKKCKSTDRSAIGTCFDIECANYNSKRPIRYCKSCFTDIHEPCEANKYDVTLQSHIRHSSIKLTIMENEESVNNFIEAIISLLKEAAPADRPSKDSERYLRSLMGPMSQFNTDNKDSNIATEEKQLISQYGIWLMTGLCKTVDKLSDELLGRLLGMLFQWFHFTACLPDDQAGSALEKLKGECIKGWIMGVKNKRLDVFISCLLPHPIDCSKIGGHWEVWPDTAHQIKEGFKRLLCLVPYDIITDDVWDEIMPYWMECFRHEVPENELSELKILLSKVFDPELSPLGFETKQMYNFISSRFEDTSNTNQEQTLYWLQIITMLEIPIPIDFLFRMMKTGVKTLAEIRGQELSRMKTSERLDKIERRAQRNRSSLPTSPSATSTASRDSTASDASSAGTLSAQEDDVLLPAAQGPQTTAASRAQATQQERQAQARAAFSAKLQQQASLLDAQHSSSVSQVSISPSSTGTQVAEPTRSQQLGQAQVRSTLTLASGHSRPLKSTTNSASSGSKHHQDVPADQAKDRPAARPKLRLNLSSTEESMASKIDNNLICYILMLDILLKQLDLQEINSRRGLDSKEAQQAIDLLNEIVSTPWVGRHTCCDSLPNSSSPPGGSGKTALGGCAQDPPGKRADDPEKSRPDYESTANVHSFSHCAQGFEHEDSFETCVFCEIISTFHQLSMSLIEYFSPVIEVSICEVSQDAANGEFDGRPDYSRIGLDHLEPSPADSGKFDFDTTQRALQRLQSQQDPSSPFSPSYLGPTLKPEVLNSLPKELQLTYNLLIQFHQYQATDIVSQLLQMIKLISLHSQILSKAAKNSPQFITWCQHNMLINKLWSLCQLESAEIARTCVPLLLHCITLPWGVRLFRDLVERDFNNENWLSRFRAVERVVTIAYFCEPSTIKNSTLLQSTMASAFCYVVRCLDDIEAIVAQRALVSLEMMKTSSLKLLLWCLEVQFDYIIADRPMILRSVFQLYNHLRDRRFLTWEFFLNRFDTIFLEAQIYLQQTGEIPSFTMQDLKNTNTKSEIYQKKIIRAREALQETHHSRSLSSRFNGKKFTSSPVGQQQQQQSSADKQEEDSQQRYQQSIKLQQKMERRTSGLNVPGDQPEGKDDSRGQPKSPMRRVLQHGNSTSSRYQSVAFFTSQSLVKRKNSKFMSNLAMQSVPPLMSLPDKLHQHLPNSFVEDGSKLNEIAQENHVFGVVHRVCDEDRDTNHSLIFLLMQFFSKSDPSHPQSMKTLNRSHQIVLRHLNILMGYSIARKNFLIAASNLRLLPVFNAFLTSLPKVLDFNYSLGTILLDSCLPVLVYCPASDDVQYDTMVTPSYSLWLLNPLMRQSWLMSVMTFMYKYQFGQPHLKRHVNMLMWIVLNTLESHLNYASSSETSAIDRLNRKDEPIGDQLKSPNLDTPTNQATVASTIVIESPVKSEQKVIEVIELKTAKESDKIARLTGNLDSMSVSTDHQQTKLLTKADTSDNLMSRSILFQRNRGEATRSQDKGGKLASTGNLLTKLSTIELSDTTRVVTELASPGDERLLPVGPAPRLRPATEPASERLLPIGLNDNNVPSGRSVKGLEADKEAKLKARARDPRDASAASTSSQAEPPSRLASQQTSDEGGASRQATAKKRHGARAGALEASSSSPASKVSPKEQEAPSAYTRKSKASKFANGKEYVVKPASNLQPSFSSPSLLSEQLAQINRHSVVEEFSDKDLSMCLVILETFIHHEPSMAAQMLPNILRLVARYSSANLDSWQTGSNAHLVGGSMFVARQFIRVALHDLMENNIFQRIFTSHFTGYEFYKSMATALADFADLNQLAPLSKLFEDLNKQKSLPDGPTLITMLDNVATYFECIIAESSSHSQATWNHFIMNWENFLRKLALLLPRLSGSTSASASLGPAGRLDSQLASSPSGARSSSLLGQQAAGAGAASSASNQFLSARMAGGGQEPAFSAGSSNAAIQAHCPLMMGPIARIILSTTKIPHLATCKTIVDPYSKLVSYTILQSQFKYEQLLEITHNCCRLYTRDREKYMLQRTIAYELVQVLKFRFFILEENLLVLLLFVLQDVGGTLAPKMVEEGLKLDHVVLNQAESYITNVSESLRQYIGDLLEFITDVQAISRINDNLIGSQPSSINRDSFGGHVKAAISQYLALEMSLNSGADNRTIVRYLPWLYSSPSLQQGPREFIDCISHIRQLSWILLGSLQHSTLVRTQSSCGQHLGTSLASHHSSPTNCQPIPIEKNSNIAEHVQVILAGFAEQSKESVLHMSSLFHAFLLCQLWTMYCENICSHHPASSEQYQFCQSTLDDFWAKITPGVLRLVGHSRVMSEMVSTHFLQLIESLIESNSSNLIRYLPMWNSVFFSYKRRNKSGNLAIRLQKCIEWQPPDLNEHDIEQNNRRLINWLEKVQYKMSHIEIQSSQAGAYYLT